MPDQVTSADTDQLKALMQDRSFLSADKSVREQKLKTLSIYGKVPYDKSRFLEKMNGVADQLKTRPPKDTPPPADKKDGDIPAKNTSKVSMFDYLGAGKMTPLGLLSSQPGFWTKTIGPSIYELNDREQKKYWKEHPNRLSQLVDPEPWKHPKGIGENLHVASDTAFNKAAMFLDDVKTPLGLATWGLGPKIRALNSVGEPFLAKWAIRVAKLAEGAVRTGYAGKQIVSAIDSLTDAFDNPTTENITKFIADLVVARVVSKPEADWAIKRFKSSPEKIKAAFHEAKNSPTGKPIEGLPKSAQEPVKQYPHTIVSGAKKYGVNEETYAKAHDMDTAEVTAAHHAASEELGAMNRAISRNKAIRENLPKFEENLKKLEAEREKKEFDPEAKTKTAKPAKGKKGEQAEAAGPAVQYEEDAKIDALKKRIASFRSELTENERKITEAKHANVEGKARMFEGLVSERTAPPASKKPASQVKRMDVVGVPKKPVVKEMDVVGAPPVIKGLLEKPPIQLGPVTEPEPAPVEPKKPLAPPLKPTQPREATAAPPAPAQPQAQEPAPQAPAAAEQPPAPAEQPPAAAAPQTGAPPTSIAPRQQTLPPPLKPNQPKTGAPPKSKAAPVAPDKVVVTDKSTTGEENLTPEQIQKQLAGEGSEGKLQEKLSPEQYEAKKIELAKKITAKKGAVNDDEFAFLNEEDRETLGKLQDIEVAKKRKASLKKSPDEEKPESVIEPAKEETEELRVPKEIRETGANLRESFSGKSWRNISTGKVMKILADKGDYPLHASRLVAEKIESGERVSVKDLAEEFPNASPTKLKSWLQTMEDQGILKDDDWDWWESGEGKTQNNPSQQQQSQHKTSVSKNAQAVLDEMGKLETEKDVPVSIAKLRKALPNLSKQEFDKAVMELSKSRKVYGSTHDHPLGLSEEDRNNWLVDTGETGDTYSNPVNRHFVALTLRED